MKEKITQLFKILQSNRQVLHNMTWIGVLQFANYLIPLLIIPYIVRVLGVEIFGKVSYAQNIITYLTIFVNYGFEYSATQEIAINKDNKNKLRSIFWAVIRFKTFLLLITFIIWGILCLYFSKVEEDRLLYFYGMLINIGIVLFPTWFFQGIEKMSKMTIFNFLIKALGAIFIVLLIHTSADYRIYLLIPSVSYIIIGVIAFYYVIKKYELFPIHKETLIKKQVVRKGFPIFLNNIFSTLYTVAGMTILGFYISDQQLGIYSGAYKIIIAVIMLTSIPISIALFPVMSRKFNESVKDGLLFFRKCLLWVGGFALTCSLSIFILSPFIVHILLGKGFEESIPVLRLFSLLPFLIITASMFTVQGMYGLQLQKYAPYVGATVGLFSIGLNFILIMRMGIYGAVWSYILSEVLEIILVALLLRYKLKTIKP